MSYLVITFDRYETQDTTHMILEANSPLEAVNKMYVEIGCDESELEEIQESINEDLKHVSDVFSCIPGEEQDILIYKV